MTRVVIDTNVIISATRSPYGTPGEIMGLVFMGELQLYLNNIYDTAKASDSILVTGDKHLLELKEPFIKTPTEYINEYRQQ